MTEPVKNRSGLTFLALLLSLSALGASGFLYYSGIQYRAQVNEQLAKQNIAYSQREHTQTREFQASIDSLNSKLGELSGNANGLVLFQINELISLSNQGLIVYNDIPNSIRLLNYAKNMLEGNNNAELTGLKFAIASDITKLDSLPKTDSVMISGELDNLVAQVAKLHLNSDNSIKPVTISAGEPSKWIKFMDNIKDNLLNLVSITRVGMAPALQPKQEEVAEDNIRVDLLSAKIALLQHDQAGWVYNLTTARSLLTANFANYQGVNEINQNLNNLLQINVSNTDANIDATLKELAKLNNLHK